MTEGYTSVRRAFDILDAVAAAPGKCTIRELADRVGVSSSTAHRLLQTLESLEVLSQDAESRRYRLGPTLSRLAVSAAREFDIRRIARSPMQELQSVTGETVGLSVRVGLGRIYLEQVPSRHYLRAEPELGKAFPLHHGAAGLVLLAWLPSDERDRLVKEICDEEGLSLDAQHARLEGVREKGYAVATGALNPEVRNLAAPIFDVHNTIRAALSITAPRSRLDEAAVAAALDPLLSAAGSISRQLGESPANR